MALYDSMIPEKKRRAETPYTFIGPTADKVLLDGMKNSNISQPETLTASAGEESGPFLKKTQGGYPNTGLVTPPTPSKQMTENIPFDNGIPAVPPGEVARKTLGNPSPRPSFSMNENAMTSGRRFLGPAQNPAGPTQNPAPQSRNNPPPGSTLLNAGDSAHPGAVPVSLSRLALAGNQMGTTRGNGFEFHGTAGDAAKFMAPVGGGPRAMGRAPAQQDPSIRSPLDISIAALDEINGKTQKTLGSPKYLSKEEGAAMGLGWKGRMAKYKEDIDAFNRASGEKAALDIESMREMGAGNRALLQAKGVNDANAIARERMGGELELNQAKIGTEKVDQQGKQLGIDAAKRMESVQQAYINEQDPVKKQELGRQWQVLNLKDGSKYQMASRKEVDPLTGAVKEIPYAFDPNTKETIEIGGKSSQNFEVLPQDITKRKPGSRYTTPDGRIVEWDGKGAKLVQQ